LLGTDWWTDCDDAVAIRMLARAVLAGEIRLAAVGINACMEHSVASLDGFLASEGLRGVRIGLDRAATDFGGAPPYQKRMVPLAVDRKCNDDAEDAVRMYRSVLAAAEEPLEIVEIGYPQVLTDTLLSLPDDLSPLTGVELFRQKVKKIWMMAGKWDEDGGLENNFCRNARSRRAACTDRIGTEAPINAPATPNRTESSVENTTPANAPTRHPTIAKRARASQNAETVTAFEHPAASARCLYSFPTRVSPARLPLTLGAMGLVDSVNSRRVSASQ
jgi:hypothetical protein